MGSRKPHDPCGRFCFTRRAAYALVPLIPLFRGILDGKLLWTWLNNELRRERVIEARRMANEIESTRQLAAEFDWFTRARTEELVRQRKQEG